MARWKSVAIEDLFDAQGRAEHRFQGPCLQEGAPLITGGVLNGVGAAGALLLLFAGTASATVRTIGFPPRLLSIDEFVLGVPRIWEGMIRPATRERCPNGMFRVVAEIEIDGMPVVAERSWILDGSTFEETVRVDGSRFSPDADAGTRLAQLLPPTVAPLLLTSGGVVRDMFDHSARSRAALDVVSGKPFLDALLRAVEAGTLGRQSARNPIVIAPASLQCASPTRIEASRSARRRHAERDLVATTQELERLAEALGLDTWNPLPAGNLPEHLARRHREWLDRAELSSSRERDQAALLELGRMPECTASTGVGWAELRFVEVSASARRLEHELSELSTADETHTPPASTAKPSSEEEVDERLTRERLIDCLREFAEGVRARRAIQVSERLQLHAPSVQLTVDGSLSFTRSNGLRMSRTEIDPERRETVGFALVEAFARIVGNPLPVVVDNPFAHVSGDARALAMSTFFGGQDG